MHVNKKEVFALVNVICYIRLLLVPLFIYSYLEAITRGEYHWSASILLISVLLDFFNAHLTYKNRSTSRFGFLLDLTADRVTQISVAVCLMLRVEFMGVLVAVYIAKELVLVTTSLLMLHSGILFSHALWLSRMSSAVFYITLFFIVALPSLSGLAVNILIFIAACFMIITSIIYIYYCCQEKRALKR